MNILDLVNILNLVNFDIDWISSFLSLVLLVALGVGIITFAFSLWIELVSKDLD